MHNELVSSASTIICVAELFNKYMVSTQILLLSVARNFTVSNCLNMQNNVALQWYVPKNEMKTYICETCFMFWNQKPMKECIKIRRSVNEEIKVLLNHQEENRQQCVQGVKVK